MATPATPPARRQFPQRSWAPPTEPGSGDQSQGGREVAQTSDGRGSQGRSVGAALDDPDRGRGGNHRRLQAAHVVAAGVQAYRPIKSVEIQVVDTADRKSAWEVLQPCATHLPTCGLSCQVHTMLHGSSRWIAIGPKEDGEGHSVRPRPPKNRDTIHPKPMRFDMVGRHRALPCGAQPPFKLRQLENSPGGLFLQSTASLSG